MLVLVLASVVWALPVQQGAQPEAAPSQEAVLQSIRADLELLATDVFGRGVRPNVWTGNLDASTGNFIADAYYDNEQLADQVFGPGVRPDDWFGASSPTTELIIRNIRHDLERSANERFGPNLRPEGWIGGAASVQCDRALQGVLLILDQQYNLQPTTITAVVNYCAVVKAEVEDRIYSSVLDRLTQELQTPETLGGLRGDLERLADERLGLSTRPTGWIGNREDGSPTYLNDVFIDLDNLADNQLGIDVRPPNWIGVITASPAISYRTMRFDLETLADMTLGEGIRPNGWQGTDPLSRCDTTLQTLVALVENIVGPIRPAAGETVLNDDLFCADLQQVAIAAAESPIVIDELTVDANLLYVSRNAFSYLDVAALDFMGVMPWDTEFRPWYRNFQDSNMMFVTGVDFALFIDRRWTDVPEEDFRRLPNLEGRRPRTFCDASWCNGPGPTPTPTGSGPIIAIIEAGTPAPTSAATPLGPVPVNKSLVTWNNIRVTYLLDQAATGSAQVAMEICAEPAQVTCEPVISVYDGNTGGYKPILFQYNGLNVFDMRYGYQTNVIIEGATRYSRDVFISEPGLRNQTGQ